MGVFSFGKDERLKSEKLIKELFTRGSSFSLYPFRIVTMPNPSSATTRHQVLFSVPSKNFKLAVDRNKIRRRSREAYRLSKNLLASEKPLIVGFVYTAREIESFSLIKEAMPKILAQINKRHTNAKFA